MNILEAISQYAIDSISNGMSPLTIAVYENACQLFANYIGPHTEIVSLTTAHVRSFNVYLRTEHRGPRMDNPDRLSSASLHRYFKALRSFFRWVEENYGITPPDLNMKTPRYTNKEILPFTRSEVQKLLGVCDYTAPIIRRNISKPYHFRLPDPLRNKAIILTLLDTGIRPSELCRLRINNLKQNCTKIEVIPHFEGKTRSRTLEIQNATRTSILSYHQSRGKLQDNDFVFSQSNGAGLSSSNIGRLMRTLGKRARVPDCGAYRFRHTFAIEYLRNGGDVFTLQYFMGHTNISTTRRYLSFITADREHAHRIASPVNNWKL